MGDDRFAGGITFIIHIVFVNFTSSGITFITCAAS
jgi:hypothetical protein